MKTAIQITEYEIRWHEENKTEAPTVGHADAFIMGLKHLLDIFQHDSVDHPAAKPAVEADDGKDCLYCNPKYPTRRGDNSCPKCRRDFHSTKGR